MLAVRYETIITRVNLKKTIHSCRASLSLRATRHKCAAIIAAAAAASSDKGIKKHNRLKNDIKKNY
jgi:hypothetical protein